MAIGGKARAVWNGDLKGGSGRISAETGILQDATYTFATRFEQQPGTNPEELLAAAHAACFSMQLAGLLGRAGYQPQSVETQAICSMSPKDGGGFRISKMRLETRGKVEGIDPQKFQEIAEQAKEVCPVSGVFRNNIEIELDAVLV